VDKLGGKASRLVPTASGWGRELQGTAFVAGVGVVLLLALAATLAPAGQEPQKIVVGYSPSAGQQELALEKDYQSLASRDEIQKFHRYLTSEPHPAGSQRNNELAQWVADQWKQQGLEDVTIHE